MGVDEKETNDKHRCNGKGWTKYRKEKENLLLLLVFSYWNSLRRNDKCEQNEFLCENARAMHGARTIEWDKRNRMLFNCTYGFVCCILHILKHVTSLMKTWNESKWSNQMNKADSMFDKISLYQWYYNCYVTNNIPMGLEDGRLQFDSFRPSIEIFDLQPTEIIIRILHQIAYSHLSMHELPKCNATIHFGVYQQTVFTYFVINFTISMVC